MKKTWHTLTVNFKEGLVFLVPVVLVVIVIEKALLLLGKIINPIVKQFPGKFVGIALQDLAAILLLVLVAIAAGLFARTKPAQRFLEKLESGILGRLPGYSFLKQMGESLVGLENRKDMKVVLVRVDDAWQLAFLMEQIDENIYTVFVPDAPSPWSGGVYHIEKDKMKLTDLSMKQAVNCLKQLGMGSAGLLAKNFGE